MIRQVLPLFRAITVSAVFLVVFTASIFGSSSVDPTFIPVPSKALELTPNRRLLTQPDGKTIVVAGWNAVDGKAKGQVFRLNNDGTLDSSFSYCSCALPYTNGALLADD